MPGEPTLDLNPLRLTLKGARYLFRLFRTLYLSTTSIVWEGGRGRALSRRVVLQQVYFTAVQALPLIVLISVGSGALAMVQASVQLPRFGVKKVEAITGLLLFHELAPIVVAFIVIARSATAIIVEVGNMRVNGEIRGLQLLGVNIERLVVFPRILGMAISVPFLTILFVLLSLFGGYWSGKVSGFLAGSFAFSRLAETLDAPTLRDIIFRSLLFGIIIGTVSCLHGLRVRISATEVPQQATRGIIGAFTICFLVNIILSIS